MIAGVEERAFVVAQGDGMPCVVAPVRAEVVRVEVRPHGVVHLRARPARPDRSERDVLERDHVREHPLLLGRRLAEEHRPLELRQVAPDRRARARDEDVASLEHEVPGERVRIRRVAADLPAVAGVRARRDEGLRAVDLPDGVEHRERRLVARTV